MPIHSDERPFDMAAWVAEKADSVLAQACRLVDWFRAADLELCQADRDRIARALHAVIYDAAKLSAFGHENMDFWSDEWVNLMFTQGHDRFLEFQQRARDHELRDQPPLAWPLSFQKVLDLLDETKELLADPDEYREDVRGGVLTAGRSLMQTGLRRPRAIGDKLVDAVDDEAVRATISWSDFIRVSRRLIEEGKEALLQEAERSCQPWA